jgi:hypothetical protein
MFDQLKLRMRNLRCIAPAVIFFAAMALIVIIAGCSDDEDVIPTNGGNGTLPDTVFYSHVQPIFGGPTNAGSCASSNCHDAASPERGLNMTTYATIMAGSNSGPVVVPDSSSQSELYKRITGVSTPRMPVGGSLSASQIELIRKWIDDGARE